jgi:hypothetical protein
MTGQGGKFFAGFSYETRNVSANNFLFCLIYDEASRNAFRVEDETDEKEQKN